MESAVGDARTAFEAQDDGETNCLVCSAVVMDSLNRVLINPCGHYACKDCVIDALGGRVVGNGRARCPHKRCGRFIDSVKRDCLKMTGGGRESRSEDDASKRRIVQVTHTTPVTNIVHKIETDPFRILFKELHVKGGVSALPPGGILLTAAWNIYDDNGKLGYLDLSFQLSRDGSFPPTQDSVGALLSYVAMWRSALVPLNRRSKLGKVAAELDKNWHRRARPLNDLLANAKGDGRIFPQIFMMLLSGPKAEEQLDRKEYYQRLGVAHLITDVTMRSINPQSEVALVVNLIDFLFYHASRTEFQNVLVSLRLLTTRGASRRSRSLEYMERARQRYDIDPRGLFQFSADNIQWLVEWEAMYDHWYSCIHWHRPPNVLIELGILVDGNPNTNDSTEEVVGRLSREPRVDWNDFIAQKSVDEVLDSTVRYSKNTRDRGEVVLSGILLVIKLLADGRLPWSEDAQRRHNRNEKAWPHGVPLLYRFATKEGVSDENMAYTRAQYEAGGIIKKEGVTRATSIYKSNGLVTSLGIPLNFGSMESIEGIMDYNERIADAQVEAHDKHCASLPNRGVHLDRPPSEDIIVNVGDGAPCLAMDKKKVQEAAKGSNKYSRIRAYLGAFHARGHHFESTNEIFQETISWLVSSWTKNSRSKLNFYLDPSDINKPEHQMCQIVLAIIIFTVERMKKAGIEEISAVSTLDYLIEQAKKCTVTMTLLFIMEEYMTVVLYRIAASESDFDKYMSANKLSYPLLFGDNSVHYARLLARMFQNVFERSPFEDKIHRTCAYTGISENGEHVECDLVHEKHNGHIRKPTGKAVRRGHEANVEYACLMADQVAEMDHDNVKRSYEESDIEAENRIDYWEQDAEAMYGVLSVLRKSNVMNGNGNIIVSGKTIDTSKDMISPINGKPLPSLPLRIDTTLVKLSEDYFTGFHVKAQNQDSRSSFKFPHIPHTTAGVAAEVKKRVALATSLVDDELAANGTREELYTELESLVLTYYDCSLSDMPEGMVEKDLTKDSLKALIIDSLISVRTEIFSTIDTARDTCLREARECCSSAISEDERGSILQNARHKQVQSLRTNPTFTKTYRLVDRSTGGTGGTA